MQTTEIIKLALHNIRSNMLRTLLTVSIIAIGIMALVGILTALDGVTYALSDSFSGLGAKSFEIAQKDVGPHRRKTVDVIAFQQAELFKKRFDAEARTTISMFCTGLATVKYRKKTTNPNVSVDAIDDNYLYVKGKNLSHGRNFSETELNNGAHKAIIGQDIVNDLFDGKESFALGQAITVGDMRYKVIGILASQGSTMGGGSDRVVLVPISVGQVIYGEPMQGYSLVVRGSNMLDMEFAEAEAEGLFRQVRRLKIGEENDFEILKSDAMIEKLKENTATIRISTISIGLITLLGAAIGLMNIMLVSVTERTKEIGINKALGATQSDIRRLFLIEALLIGLIGGLLGVVLGVLVGNIVPLVMGGSFLMPWGWLSLGIALCLLVGIVSGYYPAKKAAELDPIEALRQD